MMTKNQEDACTQLEKALDRISRCNLIVVMADGNANIYKYSDYKKAQEQDNIDCGMYGIRTNDDEYPEKYSLGSGLIIH